MRNGQGEQPQSGNYSVLSHEAASAQLHAFAHERMAGGAPEQRYPGVAAHLAQCGMCRADLAEMLTTAFIAALAADEPTAVCSEPDLSRLQQPPVEKVAPKRPWSMDGLGRLWVTFSEEILRGWKPSPLLGQARGSLLYAYTDPAVDVPNAQGFREPIELTVEVFAEPDDSGAVVSVTLDLPDRDALDQSGVPVALHIDNSTRHGATDASGNVRFEQVPRAQLGQIRIAITVDQPA